jgi:hypothetical protein
VLSQWITFGSLVHPLIVPGLHAEDLAQMAAAMLQVLGVRIRLEAQNEDRCYKPYLMHLVFVCTFASERLDMHLRQPNSG